MASWRSIGRLSGRQCRQPLLRMRPAWSSPRDSGSGRVAGPEDRNGARRLFRSRRAGPRPHEALDGRLVRAVVVVVPAPGVEADLGGFRVQKSAALQELGLHGAVQPLELAHGLRVAPLRQNGAAPERLDAEAERPDRKPGELCRTVLLPLELQDRGIAVVGDHRIGQAVHLEDPRQPRADRGRRLVRASLRPEQIARLIVENGQGQAALALAVGPAIERAMTLELHLPRMVGRFCLDPLERHRCRSRTLQEPAAPHNAGDRARRRHGRAGLDITLQHPPDLPPAPHRVRPAQRQGRRRHRPPRRHFRPPRAVHEPVRSQLGKALPPFVARLPADPEPPTKLGHVRPGLPRQRHQIQPLRHRILDFPRHRQPPECARPGVSPIAAYGCCRCLRSIQRCGLPAFFAFSYASSSIRVGSSMHCLTRTRKLTASRPSMIRWS